MAVSPQLLADYHAPLPAGAVLLLFWREPAPDLQARQRAAAAAGEPWWLPEAGPPGLAWVGVRLSGGSDGESVRSASGCWAVAFLPGVQAVPDAAYQFDEIVDAGGAVMDNIGAAAGAAAEVLRTGQGLATGAAAVASWLPWLLGGVIVAVLGGLILRKMGDRP